MGLKSLGGKFLAEYITAKTRKWKDHAGTIQQNTFKKLIRQGKATQFGKDHGFDRIETHRDFVKQVPVRGYEEIRPYIDQIIQGDRDVLWPGKPLYFAKTSGTTSGVKYIPITKASIPNHINTARDALLHYIKDSGNTQFINGNMIFLSGSPEMHRVGGILTGRLSGIVNHHVPSYLQRNQVPTYETNCIEDWEAKVEAIIEETLKCNMTLISGIPPWVLTYFEKLLEQTGKPDIKSLFPNFSLLVHGGVNFSPYEDKLKEIIGTDIDTLETFPASEGFFAFQDKQHHEGMLLNIDSGIFYEFIPLEEVDQTHPTRLTIDQVEQDKHYALVVSNNAGLWAYNVGDTVKFVSLRPPRLVVTGRIKHFISAFGEHVINEEVETAMKETTSETGAQVSEFTVAPVVNPEAGNSRHEWLVEFSKEPNDLEHFKQQLDAKMCRQNIYYKDLIDGQILDKLELTRIQKNGFNDYMKSIGKLGGQNKLPRLSNDRQFAEGLEAYALDNKLQP